YMFYKVLKAGYTICYQADAYVWHKHRKDMKALKRQVYNYSRGHVAYHLHTWLNDNDWRGYKRIFYELPKIHMIRFAKSLVGRSNFPISMILLEIAGNILGPWAFYSSLWRVKKLGRSARYIPPKENATIKNKNAY
ncbi:hypothetical protein OCK74_16030, partial [Chitinophagaceae bacterium LB-8]|nr:hypothetical protein [Paraflavisolibacter caeni]